MIAVVTGTSALGDQLGALASEAIVGVDPDLDVEVALAAAGRARVPGAGDPHPLAVLDPRRDVDLPGAHLADAPRTTAALARRLGDPAIAATAVAGHRADDLAEDAAAHLTELPVPRTWGRSRSECRARRRCPGSARRR